MSRHVELAGANDIPEGEARVFTVDETRIALCKVEGRIYAIEDLCTHDDGPLGEGCLSGFEIECPRHGARFDVRSGAVTRMPAAAGVGSFPVTIEGDKVLIEIEED